MRCQMQPATADNRAVAHRAAKPTLQCRVYPRRRRYFATSREQVSASGSHSVNEKPTPPTVKYLQRTLTQRCLVLNSCGRTNGAKLAIAS
jgi:hypothetical protein